MKDTIYTIPLTDAFKAEDECPFCFIHRKLEQDAIYFTLGASYMEDDIRAVTDEMGFCSHHFKKLYDYGNKLGLALILHTHYKKLYGLLDKNLAQTELPSPSFRQRLQKSKHLEESKGTLPITKMLNTYKETCYICDRVDKDMERYMRTFFYLFSSNKDFKALFLNSKGFCLEHFSLLIDGASLYLKKEEKDEFFIQSKKMLLDNIKRIEEDLSWFIDKYDYKNNDAPWKNSKDAIPRSIQKLVGIYPQDEPFKAQN